MELLDLMTLTAFVLVACVVWLSVRALFKPRRMLVGEPLAGGMSALATPGAADRRSGAFVESLAAQLPAVLFAGEEFDKDFRRAGYYGSAARQRFFALRNGLVILSILVTGAVVVAIGPEHRTAVTWTLVVGLMVVVASFSLPRVVLGINAKRRVEQIRGALPDAMDTVSMCLQGGISLQECLGYVGQEMLPVHPDLAFELLIVSRQADINSFEFAFQQFAGRIDAPEVVSLAALVTQNQRLGTGVVDAIREFADNLRLKQRQTAEAKARRAELFLLFPVIFCLVPSILLILWGPPILSLIDFITGPRSPLRIIL